MNRFAEAARLHELAETWSAYRRLAEHGPLQRFSYDVGRFIAELGEERDGAYWGGAVRALLRARWDMATVPLRFSSPALGLADALETAGPRLRQAKQVVPDLAAGASNIVSQLEMLAENGDDPLGDAVLDQLRDIGAVVEGTPEAGDLPGRPKTAVLLRHGRAASALQEALSERGVEADVLTQGQLATQGPYESIVAVGPMAWFDPRVLRAPHARQLAFVYFGWLRDSEPQLDLLLGSVGQIHRSLHSAPPRTEGAPPGEAHASEWVPSPNWGAIVATSGRSAGEASGEPVEAWLFVLASEEGVYLEAGEGSRAYIAELEDELTVHQVAVEDIAPGTYVVLRTAGEGDYIRETADGILGEKAAELRELQEWWKQRLRNRLDKLGMRRVLRRLEDAGAVRASEENVRRWSRADSIKTRDPADFRAIMVLIGAEERTDELWQAMSVLDAAHQRAGMRVRKLLVAEILAGDPQALAEKGWADYDAEEIEGEGALRVARVEDRAPERVEVPRGRTRHPFPLGRDLWLG